MYHQHESSQEEGDRLLAEFRAERDWLQEPPIARPSTFQYALQLICVGPNRLLADMALVAFILFGAAAGTAAIAMLTAPHPAPPLASGAFSATTEANSSPAADNPPASRRATREAR
ncbi:hypothetical protein [Rhizorhabdus sp.]|uniref:hypothetical protein n=1 Tax=Rhizorhabdus sp. TaxID=1968843 RepID=UPI0019A6BFD9|nr:hypothetical protein [Rhizorhabdus sp.]MBD3762611.1 hypothetical protein [Rhizorhabdus sp.]